MGMIFDWRPNTPLSILMRWSVSVYATERQRIQTTISQRSAIATTASVAIWMALALDFRKLTSASTTSISRATGIISDFATKIQCW